MEAQKQARTLTADKPRMNSMRDMFPLEYVKDFNATKAAERAGYSVKSAKAQGARLLSNVAVRARIEALKGERVARTQVDADWVVNRLVSVVERCMQHEPVMIFTGKAMEQKTDDEGKGVYQFDSAGANKALELLGKHLPEFFGAKPADAGNLVQWIENKTYIDASQHVHTNAGVTAQPTPTHQQISEREG